MSLKIQQLQHFVMVTEKQGFRNAAKEAHRTQAALSNSIKALEESLGQALFEKGYKSTLTPYGEVCLPHIKKFLEAHDNLEWLLKESAAGNQNHIRIGYVPSVIPHILAKILPEFTKAHPLVKVSLTDNASLRIYQRLIDNNIDVAISSLPSNKSDDIDFILIETDRLGVVCHKNHPLAKQKELNWQQLRAYPFIKNGISVLLNTTDASILNETALHTVDNILSIISVLELEIGITVLSKLAFPKDNPHLVWIPLSDPVIHREIGIMYPNKTTLAPQVQAFVDLSKQMMVK